MDDFDITIEDDKPAPVFELPSSERAHVRHALREHFGAQADIEPWLEHWIGSCATKRDFVLGELEEILPPCIGWLAGYVDLEALARDWSDCCRVIFAADRRGTVHVFAWLEAHNLDPGARRETK